MRVDIDPPHGGAFILGGHAGHRGFEYVDIEQIASDQNVATLDLFAEHLHGFGRSEELILRKSLDGNGREHGFFLERRLKIDDAALVVFESLGFRDHRIGNARGRARGDVRPAAKDIVAVGLDHDVRRADGICFDLRLEVFEELRLFEQDFVTGRVG